MTETNDAAKLLADLKDRALDVALEGFTISDARQPGMPLIYVNHGFEILTGYTAAEVLGKNCRFLQGERTNEKAKQRLRKAIETCQPCVVEILNYHKNGSPFWNRLSITPVRDEDGQTTHFIGVQSDVTARRRASEKLHAANRDMQQALEAAAQIQQSLLPHGLPMHDGVEIAWRFEPCATLAGDILNAFWLDQDRLGCYVLDVMGHGVSAALLSVTLSHFLTPPGGGVLSNYASPAEVATALNRRFPLDSRHQQFFTLVYGVLDTQAQTFRYTCAGHPPLIHVPSQAPAQISQATGFPIGVMDTPDYKEHCLHLQSGDRVYLYSDGIIEAGQQQGQAWGIQGLCDFVSQQRAQTLPNALDAIVTETRTRHGNGALPDDVSILALESK